MTQEATPASDEVIAKIEAALEKATPEPWPWEYTGDGKRIIVGDGLVEGPNGYEVAEVYSDDCPQEIAEANAAAIVLLRNETPALLARLRAETAAREAAEARETALVEFFDAVDSMTTRWTGTQRLAGIYPARSDECDDDEDHDAWNRFAAAHRRARTLLERNSDNAR